MKRRRGAQRHHGEQAETAAAPGSPGGLTDSRLLETLFTSYLRPAILALATALLVATPLIPSEGIVRDGSGATWHVMWLWLAVLSLLGSVLCTPAAHRWLWADLCVVLLVGWHIVSAAVCDGNQRQAWNAGWQWAAYGALAIVFRQQLTSAKETRALVAVLLSMAVAISLLAYYQFGVIQPKVREAFHKNPEAYYEQLGLTKTDMTAREQARNRIESKEPTGEFALTNTLAGYLLPWLVVALGIAFWSVQKEIDRRSLLTLLVVAALISGVLVLTKSRTAWLAAVAGVGLIFLYGRPSGWRLDWRWPAGIAAAVLVIGLIGVAFKGLDAKVLSESPKSVLYRLEYWRATAGLIADEPWFGVGPGNFQERYVNYKLPEASETVQDPHNFMLEIWSTAGTPALLALLALFFTTAWQLGRAPPQTPAETVPVAEPKLSDGIAPEMKIGHFAIYAGAVLGLMLGGIVALITEDLLTTTRAHELGVNQALGVPIIWMTGLASLFGCLIGLHAWIERGELPRSAVVIALLALLLNLLAAGAAIFAGVVNAAWLLWAISLQQDDESASSPVPEKATGIRAIPWHQVSGVIGGVLAIAALIGCYTTEFQPVNKARTLMSQFMQARVDGHASQALALLEDAKAADPWSPDPWRIEGELALAVYFGHPIPKNWNPFLDAMEEYRRRSPHHYVQHEQRGRWLLNAARRTNLRADRLQMAAEAYETAIRCYPNSALLHAQLALVYTDQKRTADARREAEEAARLDALCPHQEQKLEKKVLYDPQPLLPATAAAQLKPRVASEFVNELRGVPQPPEQKSTEKSS